MVIKGISQIKYEVGKFYLDNTTKKTYVIISCVALKLFEKSGYYVTAREL